MDPAWYVSVHKTAAPFSCQSYFQLSISHCSRDISVVEVCGTNKNQLVRLLELHKGLSTRSTFGVASGPGDLLFFFQPPAPANVEHRVSDAAVPYVPGRSVYSEALMYCLPWSLPCWVGSLQ